MEPRVFEFLLVLLDHAGDVLTKEELLQRVWGDAFVSENVVARAAAKLRQALGDDPRAPRYLETVHAVGYRMIVQVERLGRKALAVLPLVNLTGDPEQEYLADGMTEALISDLGSVGALRVISRRTAMRYKGSTRPLDEIAAELGVHVVIEGSVVRSGDQVRVGTQLITPRPERVLRTMRFDGELGDILGLYEEVTRAVVDEVRVALSPGEARLLAGARAVDSAALEAYFKGRFHWHRMNRQDLEQARDYFRLALEKDPKFAPAWCGISDFWGTAAVWGGFPPTEALARGRPAAVRALELDENLAEAHEVMARWETYYGWNWAVAETLHKRAVELRPSFVEGHLLLSVFHAIRGDREAARSRLQLALELDPHSSLGLGILGWLQLGEGQVESALENLKESIGYEPNSRVTIYSLWHAYECLGMFSEALEAARQCLVGIGHGDVVDADGSPVAEVDYRAAMRMAADELVRRAGSRYVQPTQVARVLLSAAEPNRALEWVRKAFAAGDPFLTLLPIDASWQHLVGSSAIREIHGRMNLLV